MRKKTLFLGGLLLSASVCAQQPTFVSTEPSDKNVVIEEFTGVDCYFCPDGHRVVNNLIYNNPDRVFAINIHQGSYANTNPNYRTVFGDAIANQAGLDGYPSATVNRHLFSGVATAIGDRGQWATRTAQILAQSSYVNIAAKSTLDVNTRELTVNVEIFYTANSPVAVNNLNIALLQDNIIGRQVGMGLNPDQIVEDLYNHQHMLRHLLTSQWGDEITTTSAGSFVSKTYTYTIPPHLNNVGYQLHDLEVIVFIAEGRQEIITGAKSEMQIIDGYPVIRNIKEIEIWSGLPEVLLNTTVFNFTDEDFTDLQFTYTLNEGPENVYNYSKIIKKLETDTLYFNLIPVISGVTYNITVTLTGYNGKEFAGVPFEITDRKNFVETEGDQFMFILATDRWGSQTSFTFMDSDRNIIRKDGPFTDLTTDRITPRQYRIEPPKTGWYKLEVYDTEGNGINSGNGEGYLKFMDIEENEIFFDDGKFGYQANYYIYITTSVSIDKNNLNDGVRLYPNPVKDELRIANYALREGTLSEVEVEIFDVFGRKQNNSQLSILNSQLVIGVSHLPSGIYLIKIFTENGFTIKKFIKK